MTLEDRLNFWHLRQEQEEGDAEATADVAESEVEDVADSDSGSEDESPELSISDILSEQGLGEFAGEDDVETLKKLGEQAKSAAQYREQMEELSRRQQIADYQIALAAQQAQQSQQFRQAPPPQYYGALQHWDKRPEYNDQWLQFLDKDENGNTIVKPGGDPTLPQRIAAYTEWQRQGLNTFLADPRQFVQDAIYSNPEISAGINQMIQAAIAPMMQQREAERLIDQSSHILFEHDERGAVKRDQSGTPVPTQVGKFYMAQANRLANSGLPLHEQHALALELARSSVPQPQQASPAETRAQKKLALLKNGAKRTRPNRGVESSTNKRPIGRDLAQEMRQALAAAGVGDEDIQF